MGYILSIYSAKAFKEFLLPSINNADHSIIINKNIFSLEEDVEITMEVIENVWYFLSSTHYTITTAIEKRDYANHSLKGNDLLTLTLRDHNTLSVIVKELEDAFVVYDKFDISSIDCISIGRSKNCHICYNYIELVSKEHAVIRRNGNLHILEDRGKNGVFVNSMRIVGSWQLTFGDCIDIFGLRMVYLGHVLAVNTHTENVEIDPEGLRVYLPVSARGQKDRTDLSKPIVFHRAPRVIPKIEDEPVEIEAPPSLREKEKMPLAMMIGPSLTMALPMLLGSSMALYSSQASGGRSSTFMYTGIITAVSSALIGVIWTLINLRYSKKKERQEELHRFEAYGEYLVKCADKVKGKYEKNTLSLKHLYPAAHFCCNYTAQSPELWNRNTSHGDFLYHRLGIGSMPFQVPIEVPKEKFTMLNDSLAEKPRMIRENYKMLHDVPICVDLLRYRLVGIIGGMKKEGALMVIRSLVAQIASANCYPDVKLVFIYNEKEYAGEGTWSFAKWLPHVWSEDKKTRYVAGNKEEARDVLYELTKIFRNRMEEAGSLNKDKIAIPKPYYLLIVANPELLEGELITKYIFDANPVYGLTTLLLEENYADLPNACEFLIQNDKDFKGMYRITDDVSERISIVFDQISELGLEQFARRLANFKVSEMETGGDIPNGLNFMEMHGISHLEELNIMERWRKNRTYDSMRALVGQKAGGAPCYLDVHEKYHGPHGLVAGTTGSGKSETLQTYMLSLAINFSPDDIGYFIIDYKGGGMANLFSGLPHMVGQISNLSGNQVHRAMVSIKSENMRRQRVFNEHGVNNINLYTKLYKNNEAAEPVPHLFIIIDEFAELKREEPDFMRELISVAQVGRSLGVHLILATQKPGGTVDDNIWSNSKFKLCLRVQDKQDSNDMLHKPDAAFITQAGRCYLQVGNDELYELFQSGYSGAVYDENGADAKSDIAKMLSVPGRAALIGSRTKLKKKEENKKKWVILLLTELEKAAEDINASLLDCIGEPDKHSRLIRRLFTLFEEENIEYPESDYNTNRINDLLELYKLSLVDTDSRNKTAIAEKIIVIAASVGRKLPEVKEKTELDAVVEYLAQVAAQNGYTHNLQLWLPVLPTEMYLDELQGYKNTEYAGHSWTEPAKIWNLSAYVGLYDDPVSQAQGPLILDLSSGGHHAVCGTVVSGKSTFLQTFVYSLICKYTPDMINIYAIDFGSKMLSAFERAPQTGGVIYEGEEDRLAKFFAMLSGIMEERKRLFRGGNYSQYVQANGVILPSVILVIDNFANFRNKSENKYEDFFIELAKEGVGYGIFIVMTAGGFGATEIPSRIGDNLRTTISLEMGDKFQYADIMRTLRIEVMPEVNVKGRGLVHVGDAILEFQTALALRAEDDFKRMEAIQAVAEDMAASWNGKRAKAIPEIPKNPVWKEFAELDDVNKMLSDDRCLPIGYSAENASVYGIDLKRTYCYMLSGKGQTGKTNLMKVMVQSALKKGGRAVVIDFDMSMSGFCEQPGIDYLTDDDGLMEFFRKDMLVLFKERNQQKKQWIKEGLLDDEIYEKMQEYQRIFIFITNLPDFVQHAHKRVDGEEVMAGFITNLLDKGTLHNVFWMAAFNQDDYGNVAGMRSYELFARYKKGIHLGGNTNSQRIFDFDFLPFMEQTKSQKPGVGILPSNNEEETRKVIIPLCR